jgi:hypothetical protein
MTTSQLDRHHRHQILMSTLLLLLMLLLAEKLLEDIELVGGEDLVKGHSRNLVAECCRG